VVELFFEGARRTFEEASLEELF